ncbi:MAG: septal ring lytic transglycosylase RlpA family protein [Campylobacterota bacterium]|nr:septal ring lytic transglycosylase RlpA family protein [Campylobacterota bacterium]
MYMTRVTLLVLILLLISGCSTRTREGYIHKGKETSTKPNKKNYSHPTMRPYTIHGKRYYPSVVHVGEIFHGRASWYGPNFHGKLTSNGETYDMHEMTAAHKTLPMNTIVRATNKTNGRAVIVRINDRGPFVETRIIDLSKEAAIKIDMIKTGTAPIKLEIIGFEQKGKKTISSVEKLQHGVKEKVLGSFSVQIGAFSKFEGALYTQEKYNNLQGYKAVIKDVQKSENRVFRVFLNGFKSYEEAQDFINENALNYAVIIRE